jgi:hypothetical protein
MPVSKDEPRDLKSRLRHFNLYEDTPRKTIEPRDPVIGAIQEPGTIKPKHGKQAPGVLGWDDLYKKNDIKCRWCGTEMYFYAETDMEILYACPYPGCENNPDTPEHVKIAKKAARSMETREKQW